MIDVNSGSVHIFDEASFDLLGAFGERGEIDWEKADKLKEKHDKASLAEAYLEINRLIKAGLLFCGDSYESIASENPKGSVIKSICLNVAHACNMRCEYCFADEGDYGGLSELMSAEVGKRAIDFLIRESGERHNLEVDFFGGEPLMNFGAVREIVEYARGLEAAHGKNFRFTITTNGVLLDDEKIEYINREMSNVVLSIDGRREVNDRVRRLKTKGSAYDEILPKFLKVAEGRNQDNYYVRGTFTRYNKDFSKDVLHLADLGFKQISIEPVAAEETAPYAIREADLGEIFAEYERLAREIIKRRREGRGFNFFHFLIDLESGPCIHKLLSGCGVGHEYVAVSPGGDIYPCHQFVGHSEYKMGSVLEKSFDREMKKMFEAQNVYTKEECRGCWAKFYCGGGCAANARFLSGGLDKPYKIACEMERKRVECAIAILASA